MLAHAFTKDGAPTDGIVQHPRAYVTLKTIVDGKEVDTAIIPNKVTYHKGDHTKAHEVSVTLDGAVLPFPLRLIGGSVMTLYLGVTEEPEGDVHEEKNLRFIGFVEDFDQDDEARTVTLKAFDLSMPLRKHKPLLPVRRDGVLTDPTPRYSDTLEQAIDRILSVVPGFEEGTEPFLDITRNDSLKTAQLGSLVHGRAKTGPIYLKPEMSAWEAVELVCGLAVRHVSVELTDIVVRTSEEVFSHTGEADALHFIVGTEYANAYPPKIHKKIINNRKGVRVVAWDAEACERVEAVYPDDATMKSNYARKRPPPPKKKKKTSKPSQRQTPPKEPEREVYELEGHYTQEALAEKAKSIWLQRATQEADGTISTPLWTDEVLDLSNGDRFFIRLDDMLQQQIEAIGNRDLAVTFLQQQFAGMGEQAARTLLDAMDRSSTLNFWYVNTIVYDWPSARLCTVGFINLLEV
jgi:hypothetical protein